MKKLYRSEDRILAGVCGGIGDYTNIDPVIIRLIWVIIGFVTGIIPSIIVYLLAVLIIPEKPQNKPNRLKRAANI